jgi:hypothetical protein
LAGHGRITKEAPGGPTYFTIYKISENKVVVIVTGLKSLGDLFERRAPFS